MLIYHDPEDPIKFQCGLSREEMVQLVMEQYRDGVRIVATERDGLITPLNDVVYVDDLVARPGDTAHLENLS